MSRYQGFVGLLVLSLAGALTAGCQALGFGGSTITAGKAQMMIKEGVSTKADVIKVLGAPNIHYRKKDGSEMWSYESVGVRELEVKGGAGAGAGMAFPGANALGLAFFNVDASRRESSMRTMTLTIYFNRDGVVTSYETYEAHF